MFITVTRIIFSEAGDTPFQRRLRTRPDLRCPSVPYPLGFSLSIQCYGILDMTSTRGSHPQLAGSAAGLFISVACLYGYQTDLALGELPLSRTAYGWNFAAVYLGEQVGWRRWFSGNRPNNRIEASLMEMCVGFRTKVIASHYGGCFMLMWVGGRPGLHQCNNITLLRS